MNKLLVLSLALATTLACSKKENEVNPAVRQTEDTVNPGASLVSDDPATVRSGLETWHQYYPKDINKEFILPTGDSTALGLVAAKYFQSENKAPWLEIMNWLLDKGADPNIFFTYKNARPGILHLAASQNDAALVEQLIKRFGTEEPPLRLSCDVPREVPSQEGTKRLKLNLQEQGTGRTPLHYAVQNESPNPAFVEYLLLQGANPDIQNEALQLASPFQLVSKDLNLSPIFARYSGSQIRYDSRLNSLINDELEKPKEQKATILNLAVAYREMVEKEGFQSVQDINRVITLCKTGEKANLMGYVVQNLFPEVSKKVPLPASARNNNIKTWITDYGAKFCLNDNLSLKDKDGAISTVSLKDYVKASLVEHSSDPATAKPVKNLNKTLWCTIVKVNAVEGGCWDATMDETLTPELACTP